MIQSENELDQRINTIRQQLAVLDSKREVLMGLLKKLERRKMMLEKSRQGEGLDNVAGKGDREEASSSSWVSGIETVCQVPDTFSVSDDHVQVFMSLFQGRTDVYARRWENRRGRSGYSPACQNEWVRGKCGKPRTRCSDCEHRVFIPYASSGISHRGFHYQR
jgi:hypothetical protein